MSHSLACGDRGGGARLFFFPLSVRGVWSVVEAAALGARFVSEIGKG